MNGTANDTTIFSFVDPGTSADILRVDGRSWRDVVVSVIEIIGNPYASPNRVKPHIDELLRLARAADAITGEGRRS